MVPVDADEVAYFTQANDSLLKHVRSEDAELQEHLVGAFQRRLRLPERADYAVPDHFAKTMSPTRRRTLSELLERLCTLCTPLAGLSEMEADILCSCDPEVLDLREGFTMLMLGHLEDRLARPSLKDRGDPTRTWDRLMKEFGEWYLHLACSFEQGHGLMLTGTERQLAWALFERTWSHLVGRGPDGRVEVWDTKLTNVGPVLTKCLGWGHHDDTARLIARTRAVASDVLGNAEEHRTELATLAADIREMRPLLIRGYRAEEQEIAVRSAPASWLWVTRHQLGTVLIAPDASTRAHRLFDPTARIISVDIGLDGMPTERERPWLDLGDDAARWALGLLRPVHAYLLARWVEVERPAIPVAEPEDPVAADEVVAAACEALAAESADDDAEVDGDPHGRGPVSRVPAVRTTTLLAISSVGSDARSGAGRAAKSRCGAREAASTRLAATSGTNTSRPRSYATCSSGWGSGSRSSPGRRASEGGFTLPVPFTPPTCTRRSWSSGSCLASLTWPGSTSGHPFQLPAGHLEQGTRWISLQPAGMFDLVARNSLQVQLPIEPA